MLVTALASVALLFVPLASAANINVTIGANGKLMFDPEFVNATSGDSVVFTYAARHAVTQGTFNTPCQKPPGGFDSEARQPGTTYTVAVNDTNTIWIHCDLPGHCPTGMVFAINPPTSGNQTFPIYKARAQGKIINATTTTTTPATTATSPAHSSTTTSKKAAANKRHSEGVTPISLLAAIFAAALAIGVIPAA